MGIGNVRTLEQRMWESGLRGRADERRLVPRKTAPQTQLRGARVGPQPDRSTRVPQVTIDSRRETIDSMRQSNLEDRAGQAAGVPATHLAAELSAVKASAAANDGDSSPGSDGDDMEASIAQLTEKMEALRRLASSANQRTKSDVQDVRHIPSLMSVNSEDRIQATMSTLSTGYGCSQSRRASADISRNAKRFESKYVRDMLDLVTADVETFINDNTDSAEVLREELEEAEGIVGEIHEEMNEMRAQLVAESAQAQTAMIDTEKWAHEVVETSNAELRQLQEEQRGIAGISTHLADLGNRNPQYATETLIPFIEMVTSELCAATPSDVHAHLLAWLAKNQRSTTPRSKPQAKIAKVVTPRSLDAERTKLRLGAKSQRSDGLHDKPTQLRRQRGQLPSDSQLIMNADRSPLSTPRVHSRETSVDRLSRSAPQASVRSRETSIDRMARTPPCSSPQTHHRDIADSRWGQRETNSAEDGLDAFNQAAVDIPPIDLRQVSGSNTRDASPRSRGLGIDLSPRKAGPPSEASVLSKERHQHRTARFHLSTFAQSLRSSPP